MSMPYPPPGQAQPSYPHQPAHPHQPAPSGQLVLNLLKPSGFGSAAMITPMVTIDGFNAPCQWEQNVYPVPAGRRFVTVRSNYLFTFGKAELPVDVAPGQSVQVFYAGPLLTFLSGRIGFEPQKAPGKGAAVAFLIAVVALVVLAVLIGVYAS